MKKDENIIYILLIGLFLTIGCKKEEVIPTVTDSTLPFENDNIKLELVTSSPPTIFCDIFFFNASTGFAVSYDGKIYKTTDNGNNWTETEFKQINQPIRYTSFYSPTEGYAVAGNYLLKITVK